MFTFPWRKGEREGVEPRRILGCGVVSVALPNRTKSSGGFSRSLASSPSRYTYMCVCVCVCTRGYAWARNAARKVSIKERVHVDMCRYIVARRFKGWYNVYGVQGTEMDRVRSEETQEQSVALRRIEGCTTAHTLAVEACHLWVSRANPSLRPTYFATYSIFRSTSVTVSLPGASTRTSAPVTPPPSISGLSVLSTTPPPSFYLSPFSRLRSLIAHLSSSVLFLLL